MGMDFWVSTADGSYEKWYEIGAASFVHCILSTVAYHLEGGKRGSRYPLVSGLLNSVNEVSGEGLKANLVDQAMAELAEIKEKLKAFSPDKVIWDMEDLKAKPPWGSDISSDITDLGNYFVTSDGEDFFEVFEQVLRDAKEHHCPVTMM